LDPVVTDNLGRTALIHAAYEGHTPVVGLLLADERVNPNTADHYGDTALMIAAEQLTRLARA
jgi:ankyrin repeat protein